MSRLPHGLDVTQIHPYTSLAWSVISAATQVCLLLGPQIITDRRTCFIQVLVNQKDRDKRVIRLAGTMRDVFAFVHDADPLKAIKAHMDAITLLIKQVTECGYFITEYAKRKNFCQSALLFRRPPLISV